MKQIYLLILLFLTATIGYSQSYVPEGINYQAVVYDEENLNPGLDAKDFVLRNENVSIRFTIIETTVNGNEVFQETHTTKTDNFGLFSIIIGKGTQISSNAFSAITWGKTAHFLKVEIDKKGESNYINMGVQELWSVPYSLSTKYAENAGNGIIAVSDNGDGTMTFDYQNGSKYTTPKLVGLTGPKGDIGLTGAQGVQGVKGDKGETGAKGEAGANGATGPMGLIGNTGVSGSQGVAGIDGANGKNTLVNTTIEAAGTNCATGGTKIEYGLDANKDGILDASEIDATLTKYLCNGADGAQNAWSLTGNTSTDPATNFIGTTDAKDIVFKTNNTERIRLSSGGNLGIGTTSTPVPITFNGGNGDRVSFYYTSPSSLYGFGIQNQLLQMYSNNSSSDIAFGHGSSSSFNEKVRFKGNGNVGIGTANPLGKFHVNNDVIGSDSSFVVSNRGFVGIGTSTPKTALEIVSPYAPLRLKALIDGCYAEFYTPAHQNSNSRAGWIGYGSLVKKDFSITNQVPLGAIKMHTNNVERLIIDSIGNVGIGTSAPSSRLTVNGGGIRLTNTEQGIGFFGANPYESLETGDNAKIYYDFGADLFNGSINNEALIIEKCDGNQTPGDGGIIFASRGSDGVRNSNLVIKANGNVGIGTITPARTLHIKDVMRLEPIPTAPSSPAEGDIYFDSVLKKLRVYDGTTWQNCW